MKIITQLFICVLIGTATLAAQNNNDCFNSRFVCGNANFGNDNLNGPGINDFGPQFQNNDGCLAGEHQSAWYVFTVKVGGKLTFDIIPNSPVDYDFALWGPNKTCTALGSPIRCNFAGTVGNTGLSMTSMPAYEAALDVNVGETYYLLVDNFSNNNVGFTLNWGSGVQFTSEIDTDFTTNIACNVVQFSSIGGICNGILGYSWNFGDGSPITSENTKANPSHAYATTGTYTVTLTTTVVSSLNPADIGITKTTSKTITISKVPPVVQITGLLSQYCLASPPIPLNGSPQGGIFDIKKNQQGNYLPNQSIFSPAVLGVGTHEVRYTYTDPSDAACVGVAIMLVEVVASPNVSLPNVNTEYCINAPAFTITPVPTGGTIRINGVINSVFNPAVLGVGNHLVRYDYTDPILRCSNSITRNVQIGQPSDIVIDFPGLRDKYCQGTGNYSIFPTPIGGISRINGNFANIIQTSVLGVGIYTFSYTYTASNGCTNSKSVQFEIKEKPKLDISNLASSYCIDTPPLTLLPSPTGGVLRINGSPNTVLNPATLGLGNHTITYTYTEPDNPTCTNTFTKTITVYALPTAAFAQVKEKYCSLDNFTVQPQVLLNLANGDTRTLSPPEIAFNPSTLPVGNYTLQYTAKDPNTSCTVGITKTIEIIESPKLTILDLKDAYCQQAFPITLRATPVGGTFTINAQAQTVLNPTTFEVGARVEVRYDYTNAQGCSNHVVKMVEILPNPYPTRTEQHLVCPPLQPNYFIEVITQEEENALRAQGITPGYYWDNVPWDTRRVAIDDTSLAGNYEVWLRDADGCPLLRKKFEVIINCMPEVKVPTAFTPNGDSHNPTLKIFGEYLINLDFRLYNRWGEVVFTTNNKIAEWDGKVQGREAPAGVYVWQAVFENILEPGKKIRQQGRVNLLR